MKDIMELLGRALMSVIFFFEAYDKIFFMTDTRKHMTEMGVMWNQYWLLHNQNWLIYCAGFCLIFGSTLLLVGYRVGFAVFLILLYWVPLTFMFNHFWDYAYNDDGSADATRLAAHDIRRSYALHFMKNIAIVGGLLLLYVNGSGRYSVKRLLATTRVHKF